jgi:hypothetical protein
MQPPTEIMQFLFILPYLYWVFWEAKRRRKFLQAKQCGWRAAAAFIGGPAGSCLTVTYFVFSADVFIGMATFSPASCAVALLFTVPFALVGYVPGVLLGLGGTACARKSIEAVTRFKRRKPKLLGCEHHRVLRALEKPHSEDLLDQQSPFDEDHVAIMKSIVRRNRVTHR